MKLYNTLSQKLETFKPLEDNKVKMYVCGITPYDTTHLGHAFTFMAFDVLQRYLQYQGLDVTYVQNVTDIDDDILKRAKRDNQDWMELGKFWTDKFLTDIKALTIQMPTHYVNATHTIPTIITIIKALQKKGCAYENDGNVYFEVQKDKDYGKLSKYSREQMLALSKERGANPDDPLKKDPLDFILWQKSLPHEPYWEAPWSKGRPGWHIECSAIAYKYLDINVDIHGGGSDLIYPHHESEIAQTEQFTEVKPFSKYWMHTGAVGYQGEKMSKSLGNLVLVSDVLADYSADALRYLLLTHHYRTPWEFKEPQLKAAEKKVTYFKKLLQSVNNSSQSTNASLEKFEKAMENDLDTPSALAIMENAFSLEDIATIKKITTTLGFSF